MRIILASASPRRRELLEMLGVSDFEIIPAKGEEIINPALTPAELVRSLSLCKASEVAPADEPDTVTIGADTIVVLDDKVLGKPRDEEDAADMLRALSGRSHAVYTGITVIRGEKILSHAERTEVKFLPLSEKEIADYIACGEPMDKAGSYAIQGKASRFVTGIEGDYHNVVGLPVCRLGLMLKEVGVES